MLLIKNPERKCVIYVLVFFLLITIYHIEIIGSNEKMIMSFLEKLHLKGRMTFIMITAMPFVIIYAIVVSGIIFHFGQIKDIHFTETKIEINTKFHNLIYKNKINEVVFVENVDDQIIRIILKCKRGTFAIQQPDTVFISKIKNYLKLEKEDKINFQYRLKLKLKRKTYELNKKNNS